MEFVQEAITTLHDFGTPAPSVPLDDVAVVVPIMAEDLAGHEIDHVLSTLASVDPGRIVLCVRAPRDHVTSLGHVLERESLDANILWCNAPSLESRLEDAGIDAPAGKGRDVWLGMILAATEHGIVVVHDADAQSYAADLVPRMAWPIANGYGFVKGYYARVEADKLYGRLVRLVWMPLLDILEQDHPFVRYLGAFRYPLAGEIALRSDLVSSLQLAPRWGLETSLLGEMYDHVGPTGTAQVDLGRHAHDHRPVTGDDGLAPMTREIVGTLMSSLEARGVDVDMARLAAEYEEVAGRYLDQYAADAAYNGLEYDRQGEREQIQIYGEAIANPSVGHAPLPAFDTIEMTHQELMATGQLHSAETPGSR